MGVYLDGDIVLRAGPQHLLHVDFVAWPALELPPRQVADDRGVGIEDRPQEALGLGLSVEPEASIDAGNDEVEPSQHLIRVVERTVGEDVGFDALQDPEILT